LHQKAMKLNEKWLSYGVFYLIEFFFGLENCTVGMDGVSPPFFLGNVRWTHQIRRGAVIVLHYSYFYLSFILDEVWFICEVS
jgi:hypothetical protein